MDSRAVRRGVAGVEDLAGNKGKYTVLDGCSAARLAEAAALRTAVECAAVHGK